MGSLIRSIAGKVGLQLFYLTNRNMEKEIEMKAGILAAYGVSKDTAINDIAEEIFINSFFSRNSAKVRFALTTPVRFLADKYFDQKIALRKRITAALEFDKLGNNLPNSSIPNNETDSKFANKAKQAGEGSSGSSSSEINNDSIPAIANAQFEASAPQVTGITFNTSSAKAENDTALPVVDEKAESTQSSSQATEGPSNTSIIEDEEPQGATDPKVVVISQVKHYLHLKSIGEEEPNFKKETRFFKAINKLSSEELQQIANKANIDIEDIEDYKTKVNDAFIATNREQYSKPKANNWLNLY